jgi:hypothetical protein
VSRIPQHQAAKGSQNWIQTLVKRNPELLNAEIRKQLTLCNFSMVGHSKAAIRRNLVSQDNVTACLVINTAADLP